MQTDPHNGAGTVADASQGNWVDRFAPDWLKPYARMARWDRAIGYQLLFWPCAWSVGMAALAGSPKAFNWISIVLFFIGAVAMRGAGCTFNDIVDRDIDDKVARTRSRPIPSGQVTVIQAAIFMVIQSLVGLAILVQFNPFSIALGIASLVLVAIYPFMKRITYWPQLFLGLAFSWGALMGWATEFGGLGAQPVILYLGCICWVIGYDTIYALQDIEDDALIGVKSTARLFGDKWRPIVGLFYAAALALWTVAAFMSGASWLFPVTLVAPAAILAWEVLTADEADWLNCKKRFKANHYVGLALLLVFFLDWLL